MTDISMQSASIILYYLDKLFLMIRPELRYIIPCLSIDLCLKFGQHITLPAAFAAYASSLCHIDIKYYKFSLYIASIAEKLCYMQSNKEFLTYVLKMVHHGNGGVLINFKYFKYISLISRMMI